MYEVICQNCKATKQSRIKTQICLNCGNVMSVPPLINGEFEKIGDDSVIENKKKSGGKTNGTG